VSTPEFERPDQLLRKKKNGKERERKKIRSNLNKWCYARWTEEGGKKGHNDAQNPRRSTRTGSWDGGTKKEGDTRMGRGKNLR